jgi:uncharacterized repeat protein (TIGR01451 family)
LPVTSRMKYCIHTAKVALISLLVFASSLGTALAIGIDSNDKYAWGENVGWLNWGTPEGAVDVPTDSGDLTGYVWGENIGWISLNCSNTNSCGTVDYGVTRDNGELAGFAWGENVGWISFSCENTASCGVAEYRVLVGDNSGVFTGYAWGENIGWISTNCLNTGSCGSVSYRVKTVSPPGPPGGGFMPGSPLAPSPNVTVSKMPSASAVRAGDPITYDVTIRNTGNASATGVFVSDTIDADTVLVWVVPTPDTNNGSTFTYDLGTLAPGASFSYQSQVQVRSGTPAGTTIENTVRVTGNNFGQVTATSAAIVVAPGAGSGIQPTPTPLPPPPPVGGPTPPAPPPPISPPGPPPASPQPSVGPFTQFVQGIGSFLDAIGRAIFGPLEESCGGPLGITACGVTALVTVAVIAALVAAIIQNELAAAVFSLLQLIGIKKKARVWGVVYDSATKHPIPAAKLELLDASGRVMEVRFTDRDGRYGFLTTPASLNQQELKASIRVTKPGYRFPSASTFAGTDYVVYEHPYRGGEFNIIGDGLLNFSIPLDPIAPQRARLSGFGRGLFGTLAERLLALGFVVGLVAVPLNYYLAQTKQNLIILIVFFLVNGIRLAIMYRPYGITIDAVTRKKLPFALVTLLDEQGTRVGFTVSDEHGRYVLSAQRNHQYDVVAYTPANVIPQRTSRQRISRLSHVGRTAWITLTIRV